MSPKDEIYASRKQQLIKAAAALFADKGYYKTTTSDIADAVGVTQPYVFHFFKSKEALYLAVLEHATERIYRAFATTNAPSEVLLESMGHAFTQLLNSHRDEILLVMSAFAMPEPAVRAYIRQEFDRIYEQIKERIERAGLPEADQHARNFIAKGMLCALAETLELPKLLP